jgi:hypothetical protein
VQVDRERAPVDDLDHLEDAVSDRHTVVARSHRGRVRIGQQLAVHPRAHGSKLPTAARIGGARGIG